MNALFQGLTKLAGFLTKGTLVAGGTTLAAERLTDNGDGGIVSNGLNWAANATQNGWKRVTEFSSIEQGRNKVLDAMYNGQAMAMGLISGIGTALSVVFPQLRGYIQSFMRDQTTDMNEQALDFAKEGSIFNNDTLSTLGVDNGVDVDPTAPGAEGPDAGTPAPVPYAGTPAGDAMAAIEDVIPDSLDGGDATKAALGAAAVTGVAVWKGPQMLKALFSAPAAGAAAGAADDVAKVAMKAPLPGWAKLIAAATVVGGGAIALDNTDTAPAVDEAGEPTEATISIMDPGGFVEDLGNGLSSLVREREGGGVEVNWENVGAGAANNTKAAGLGFTTTAGWTAGFLADAFNHADNFLGVNWIADPEVSYADQAASGMSGAFNAAMSHEYDVFGAKFDLGGGPDMNDSWAQVFNFAGGAAFGGGIVKGANIVANGAKLATVPTALTTSNANITTSAATGPIINGLTP
jgi:hypothetical protein